MAESPQRLQVGEDLYVVMVPVGDLREQEINAQVMQPREFDRLTENIRGRGQVESLPYCHQADDSKPIEIISGHHRYRAAAAAGVKAIPILLDTKPMRRSEIRAKQIAHNSLVGSSDEQILREMIAEIDNVDDLLTTGLPDELLPTVEADDTTLHLPSAVFDWRMVTLSFLPSQLDDFAQALDTIDKHSEIVGLAHREQFQDFSEAIYGYARLKNIRSMSTVVALITDLAKRELQAAAGEDIDTSTEWIPITAMVGTSMPAEAAAVLHDAILQMRDRGDINHPWQALELWAADYLAGG